MMKGQNLAPQIESFGWNIFIPNLQVWAQLNAPNPEIPFLHGKNVRTGNLENPTAQCVQPPPPPGARRVPFPIGHAGVYLRYILWYIRMSVDKNHWTALNSTPMGGTTNSAHCDFWRKNTDRAKESKSKSNTTCHCAFVASIHFQKKSWSVFSLPIGRHEGSSS